MSPPTIKVEDVERRALCLDHANRLGGIEEQLAQGQKRMSSIEEDLRPLTRIYHAVIGGGTVLTLLLALLCWVYLSDREQTKLLFDEVVKQGKTIERILVKQESIIEDIKRIDRPKQSWQVPG